MKLHLPTSLRVALLAAMVSLSAPSLWAAPTWGRYPTVYDPLDEATGNYNLTQLPASLDSNDWQMDLSVSGTTAAKQNSVELVRYYSGKNGTADLIASDGGAAGKWITAALNSGFGIIVFQGQLLVGYSGVVTHSEPGFEDTCKLGAYSGKLGSAGSAFDMSISWIKESKTLTISLNGEEVFSKEGISMTLGSSNVCASGKVPEGMTMNMSVTMKGDNYAWIVSDAEGALSDLDLNAHATQDFYFEGTNGVLNVTQNATLTGKIMAGAPIGSKEEPMVGFNIASGVTLTTGVDSGAEKFNLTVTGGGTLALRGTGMISTTKSLSLLGESSLVFSGVDGSVVFGSGTISATSSISATGSSSSLTVGLGGASTELARLSATKDLTISGKGNLTVTEAQATGKIVVGVTGNLTAQNMTGGTVEFWGGNVDVGTITGNVTINGATETSCVVKVGRFTGDVTLNGGRLNAVDTTFVGSVTVAGGYAVFGNRTGFAMTQSGGTSVFGSLANSTLTISSGTMQAESVENLTVEYTYQDANWNSVTETALTGVTTTGRFLWNGSTFGTSGTLRADTVRLMNGLTLQAQTLSVGTLENLPGAVAGGTIAVGTLTATTVNLDGNDWGGGIPDPLSVRAGELSITTLTNLGGLSGSAVKMTGADLHLNRGSFATIGTQDALTTLEVAAGYHLSGNTSAALITNTDMTVGDGTRLSNFRVSGNTAIAATGTQYLDAVTFVRGYDGYTQSTTTTYALRAATPGSVFAVSDVNGLDSVTVTGTVADDGLHISRLIINGTGLAFSEESSDTYTIFDRGVAEFENEALISLSDPDGYLLNIAPFVQASLALDENTGRISLTGQNRTTEIVQELSDAPNRTTVLSNMLSCYRENTLSDEMLAVFNYAGNINDPSVTMADRQQALSAASGASLASLTDAQRRGVRDAQKNIRNRVVQMGGSGAEGVLRDGWVSAGLQAWAQADGAYHSLSQKQDVAGYDYSVYGTTIGANVDLTPHWVVGGAFSAEFGSLNGKGDDHLDADINSYYLNFFARYQKGHWTHLGILTIGFDDIDTNRKVLGYSADGSTSGTSFSGYYELGYLIPLNEEGTQLIQPIVSLSLTAASLSSFTESGSIGNAGLKYDSQDLVYGNIGVGARYQAVIGSSVDGRNSVLELRAQLNEHFGDKTDEAELSFIGGGQKMRVKGTDSGSFGVQIGAGLSVPVGVSTTLFTDADAEFVSDYTDVRVNLGLRYDF
ncbi:MAG: autotransporter domain-containing protein [Akkermansia sp.]